MQAGGALVGIDLPFLPIPLQTGVADTIGETPHDRAQISALLGIIHRITGQQHIARRAVDRDLEGGERCPEIEHAQPQTRCISQMELFHAMTPAPALARQT
ncbi:hypothetical protein D3C74_449550 [compost metagenome]